MTAATASDSGLELMQDGSQLWEKSEAAEKDARDSLLRSNQLRKRISEYRKARNKTSKKSTRALLDSQIKDTIAEIRNLQSLGSQDRKSAQNLRAEAKALLSQGLVSIWQDWLYFTDAMHLEGKADGALHLQAANNTATRSDDPQLNEQTTPRSTAKSSDMSIAVVEAAMQQMPDEIDLGNVAISANANFIGHIERDQPAEKNHVPLNKIHQWRLVLADFSGRAVEAANIEFVGHMPGHVHGMPTQPRVTEVIAPGVYRISGVKFQMRGWWVIELNVEQESTGLTDTLRFNILL